MTMRWYGKEVLAKVEADAIKIRTRIGEAITTRARILVPVLTGALKGTIRVEKVGDTTVVRAGGGKVDYAEDVEEKQPYMIPAVEQIKAEDIT